MESPSEQNSRQLSIRHANSLEAAINGGLAFPKTDARAAADAAATLIACYPNGKPADPQTYIGAIVAVLAEYPVEVVRRVTSPTTGIQRSATFLPTIAELTKALEAEMLPLRRAWKRARDDAEPKREPAKYDPKIAKAFDELVADLARGLAP